MRSHWILTLVLGICIVLPACTSKPADQPTAPATPATASAEEKIPCGSCGMSMAKGMMKTKDVGGVTKYACSDACLAHVK